MRRLVMCMMMVVLAMSVVGVSYASKQDDEAKALAQRTALFVKENGREKGSIAIMDPADPLKRGKFGLVLQEFSGLCVAHALFPKLVGQNHYTLKDPDGRQFVKEAIDIAKTKGSGWFDLSFTNPDTKKIIQWKGFAQRVEGADLVVCSFLPASN
jgi:cytochrome c